jgi:hypothetical protein
MAGELSNRMYSWGLAEDKLEKPPAIIRGADQIGAQMTKDRPLQII